jgi:predicted dehydrogenase
VNAVDIGPPNDLHTEVGVAALERGADLLLEKPMARTAEECDVLMGGRGALRPHPLDRA